MRNASKFMIQGLKTIWLFTASDLSGHHGPVIHFLEVASCLSRRGYRVRAIAPGPGKPQMEVPFELLLTRRRLPWISRGITYQLELALYFLLHGWSVKPRALYVRHSSWMLVPQIWGRLRSIPVFLEINGLAESHARITGRSIWYRKWVTLIEKLSVRLSNRVFPVTHGLGEALQSCHSCPPSKITVVSNGVNTTFFKRQSPVEAFAISKVFPGFDPETIYLAYTGSLESWQGFDLLLKMMERLAKDHPLVHLLVAGQGSNLEAVRKIADSMNLLSRIHFLGEQSPATIVTLLSLCRIGLIGAHRVEKIHHDLSPMKLYTYLSMGLPVIALEMPGTACLREYKCGLTVKDNDPASFAEAVRHLIHAPAEWETMSRNARHLAETRFDWQTVTAPLFWSLDKLVP